MQTDALNAENLKFFTPFQSLSDKQLEYIISNAQVFTIGKGKTILELNSLSSDKYLLLEGSVKLLSIDRSIRVINAATETAKNPIAQLRPSRYKVTTVSASKILVLKEDVLDKAIEQSEETSSLSFGEAELNEDDHILYELIFELQQGNFILPSLPSIAIKIRETIEDENSDAGDIAKVILADPAITAKIIKAANSALYQRRKKAEDCKTAVISLGTKVTTQLVTAFTLKELFQSPNELLTNHMTQFWQHSIEIAAISYVLAKLTPGFNPEQALLAGLLHDIGKVAIMNKAIEFDDVVNNELRLEHVLNKTHAQVSVSIMRTWGFSEEFISVAEETEDWHRNNSEKADLVDIVNMAHLHSFIGMAKQKEAPIIDQIPAFHKMALGKLTPEMSISLLDESQKNIEQIKSLLHM